MSGIWRLPWLLLASLVLSPLAGAGEHVRVVLDTSESMRVRDPGGLARLATALLFDLAHPDLALDDSFEVLPFHGTQHWANPGDPPPLEIGRRLRPRDGGRGAFVRAVRDLDYDADWTYFYPGLRAAIQDLEATPRRSDVRVVVIVTDGLPEAPTREEEARRLREELLPRMARSRIWLYVLAFGREAAAHRGFFDSLVLTDDGERLGEVFVDATGDRLLGHMLELFSHAFGYTQDPPRSPAPEMAVDLEGGATPTRAVAVVYTAKSSPPSLGLEAPRRAPRRPTSPDGVEQASDVGASYALQWVLSPHGGSHLLRTDAGAGHVAVLRPTLVRLEIRPPAGGQALRTMAHAPMPLGVLVRSPGTPGDPGEVQVSFTPLGPRAGLDPSTGDSLHAWRGREGAPPPGPSTQLPEGRLYGIEAIFEREPDPREPFYAGYLEVEARRGAALVGALAGDRAHRVEVYPRVRIVPRPSLGDAAPEGSAARALERGERACGRFRFELDVGRLPHPSRPSYPVRAQIDASVSPEGPLHGATFTLDGMPLDIAASSGDRRRPPAAWSKGRTLTGDELLGEHEICLSLGRPAQQAEATVEVPLAVTLLESPYDDFRVIEPFVLKVQVARPGVLERWRSLVLLSLLGLTTLLALWFLRDRPQLPADLRVILARAGHDVSTAEPRPLGNPPPWATWLGLVAKRPLTLPGESRTLGWVIPDRQDLFRLRPASGVRLGAARDDAGSAEGELQAGRSYALHAGEDELVMRVEYEPGPGPELHKKGPSDG